jgi:hypothetical protein
MVKNLVYHGGTGRTERWRRIGFKPYPIEKKLNRKGRKGGAKIAR